MVSSENPISAAVAAKECRRTCKVTPFNSAFGGWFPIPSEARQGDRPHASPGTPKGNHRGPAAPQSVSRLPCLLAGVEGRSCYPRSECSVHDCQPKYGEA